MSDRSPAQGLYGTFVPLPLVHLTDKLGFQHVHIAPEAFKVAKAEFPDQIAFWQNALPDYLKGNLESVREPTYVTVPGNSRTDGSAQRCPSPPDRRRPSIHRS